MLAHTGKTMTFAAALAAVSPAAAQDKFELPIDTLGVHSNFGGFYWARFPCWRLVSRGSRKRPLLLQYSE